MVWSKSRGLLLHKSTDKIWSFIQALATFYYFCIVGKHLVKENVDLAGLCKIIFSPSIRLELAMIDGLFAQESTIIC